MILCGRIYLSFVFKLVVHLILFIFFIIFFSFFIFFALLCVCVWFFMGGGLGGEVLGFFLYKI